MSERITNTPKLLHECDNTKTHTIVCASMRVFQITKIQNTNLSGSMHCVTFDSWVSPVESQRAGIMRWDHVLCLGEHHRK